MPGHRNADDEHKYCDENEIPVSSTIWLPEIVFDDQWSVDAASI